MLMESTTRRFSLVRIGLVSFHRYVPMVADQLVKRASDQGSQYDNGLYQDHSFDNPFAFSLALREEKSDLTLGGRDAPSRLVMKGVSLFVFLFFFLVNCFVFHT